jgi:hypothetical protein
MYYDHRLLDALFHVLAISAAGLISCIFVILSTQDQASFAKAGSGTKDVISTSLADVGYLNGAQELLGYCIEPSNPSSARRVPKPDSRPSVVDSRNPGRTKPAQQPSQLP